MYLSVVVPAYNESQALPFSLPRIASVIATFQQPTELILVDDGSDDATATVALSTAMPEHVELRVLRMRRNMGHMAALTAGLEQARGDRIASMDADLQDPPETLIEMVRLLDAEGFDVVQGVRTDRSTDSAFKRGTARAFYWAMRVLTDFAPPADAADFRVMRREAVQEMLALPERNRVYRLLIGYLGLNVGTVGYARARRVAGRTKYPLSKMVRLALDSASSFSTRPLRLMVATGGIASAVMLTMSVLTLGFWAAGLTVPGWTSLVFLMLGSNALLLFALGLVGIYVGRIFEQVQDRPIALYEELTPR